MDIGIGVDLHGAKLQAHEALAANADALLAKQGRSGETILIKRAIRRLTGIKRGSATTMRVTSRARFHAGNASRSAGCGVSGSAVTV